MSVCVCVCVLLMSEYVSVFLGMQGNNIDMGPCTYVHFFATFS